MTAIVEVMRPVAEVSESDDSGGARSLRLELAIVLATLTACLPPASMAPADAPAPASKPASTPASATPSPLTTTMWVRLDWGTVLRTAPRDDAAQIVLEPAADSGPDGRTALVVAEHDGWWTLESAVLADPVREIPTIEGLDQHRLNFYIPRGAGELLAVLEPEDVWGGLASWPVQTDEERPEGLAQEWHIAAEYEAPVPVYWADGSVAGEATGEHAFVHPPRELELDGRGLSCFGFRVGPRAGANTELCYPRTSVVVADVDG